MSIFSLESLFTNCNAKRSQSKSGKILFCSTGLLHYFSGQEAFGRNSVNPVRPILLSVINRRNIYGETLLHRAVVGQDLDLVCNIIKAGGNVNVQDYAGKLQLYYNTIFKASIYI